MEHHLIYQQFLHAGFPPTNQPEVCESWVSGKHGALCLRLLVPGAHHLEAPQFSPFLDLPLKRNFRGHPVTLPGTGPMILTKLTRSVVGSQEAIPMSDFELLKPTK